MYLLIYCEGNIANIIVIYGKFTNIFNFQNREENQFKTKNKFSKQTGQNSKSNCFVINLNQIENKKKVISSIMP